MKAWIDRDGCIFADYVQLLYEVFRMDDEDIAEVYVDEIPEDVEDMAQRLLTVVL